MRRIRLASAAAFAAAALIGGGLACADPPAAPATATDQIGQGGPARHDVGPDQIDGVPAKQSAVGVGQLAPASQPAAQTQLSGPSASRDTRMAPVAGRDRCDPASPEAKSAQCAHIAESRAADLPESPGDATTNTVDPNAPSGDLVNGILSSGTGSVVQLPPK